MRKRGRTSVKVEYIPLGGAGEVGASCGLLRIGDRRLLIDAGMRPSARAGQDRLPALDRLTAAPPEAILVTHAHIDHTGALPLASEMFPTAPIWFLGAFDDAFFSGSTRDRQGHV